MCSGSYPCLRSPASMASEILMLVAVRPASVHAPILPWTPPNPPQPTPLQAAKKLSDEIAAKQKQAESTEAAIDRARTVGCGADR